MGVAPLPVERPRQSTDLEVACNASLARPTQILVEGREDLSVVCAILGIPRRYCADTERQVHAVGRKDNFGKVLPAWSAGTASARYFRNELQRVVLVRDANGDPAAAHQAVVAQLRQARCLLPDSEPAPAGYVAEFRFTTQVVRLPTHSGAGALEDEVLAALDGDPDLALSDVWLTQAVAAARYVPRSPENAVLKATESKARIQSYLSLFTHGNYKLLGAAFDHGIIDGAHPAFDGIRQALL